MIKAVARAALAALCVSVFAAPAQAQTDDRILNDVLTLVRGEALIAETVSLCLGAADMDLSADMAGWAERNGATLATAERVVAVRGGFGPGVREAIVEAARSEAARSFVRETDRQDFCDRMGETMKAGNTDFVNWFPRETARMAEAEAGEWPLLDLTDAQPVADAMAVKQIMFMVADVLVRCGVLFEPARQFEEARAEWEARNAYSGELADRVLRNWGAMAPARWEAVRDEAGSAVDVLFADASRAEAHCRATASRAVTGEEDIDQVNPALAESVRTNADIIPR